MKHLHLFFSLVFAFGVLKAQNDYEPFPYDSVFFESYDIEVLMPVLKSDNPDNLLKPINNMYHWILADVFFDYSFEYNSWMGKVFTENQKINFVSALEDTISIDLSLSLNETDTMPFQDYYGEAYNLIVTYADLLETDQDTVKTYTFKPLRENGNVVEYDYWLMGYIGDMNFKISKHNGILACPSFYYFPQCKQYGFYDKITNVLDTTVLYAYQVFSQSPGDEVHTRWEDDFNANDPDSHVKRVKSVCVNQTYDENTQLLIRVNDIWKREDFGLLGGGGDPEFSFYQLKDTIDIGSYTNLNKIIPDGIDVDGGPYGYFYNKGVGANHGFESEIEYDKVGEGAVINIGYTPGSDYFKTNYQLNHRVHYFFDKQDHEDGAWFHRRNYVYEKINGEETGTPYPDFYLMDIEETESLTFGISLMNSGSFIRIDTPIVLESARIYDISGKFLHYYSGEELHKNIQIDHLKSGIYVFIGWDGEKSFVSKFIK